MLNTRIGSSSLYLRRGGPLIGFTRLARSLLSLNRMEATLHSLKMRPFFLVQRYSLPREARVER